MEVKFFWERWQRAACMDKASKLQGKPCHSWVVADEWVEAYKSTLTNNKRKEFEKEWAKLDAQLESYVRGDKGAVNPMKIG